jgi:HK97 family phage prohead protease
MNRAYSLLEIKSIDDDERVIEGIATTPSTDRMEDVIEPKGAVFKLPLPLLWQHDSRDPVGHVFEAKATDAGIKIRARFAKVDAPASLKEELDRAWAMVKSKLVRGLSIGFRPLEDPQPIKGTYGLRYTKWDWLELSAVTIPANADASITAIKSADQAARRTPQGAQGAQPVGRSAGNGSPDASGRNTTPIRKREGHMKTLQQMMEERATKSARMTELIELRSTEKRQFTAEEATEFDALDADVAELEDDIRIKRFEERQAASATRVQGKSTEEAAASRGGLGFVRKTDPDDKFKGQAFVRAQIAKALSYISIREGNLMSPGQIAEQRWGKTNPNLVNVIKAGVAGGGTGSGEWGSELADSDTRFTGDFIEFLYAATVFDRLPLRPIPARVHIKGQDGAATGFWVGESKAIPATKPDFSDVELTPLKVGAIAVCSKELVADSSPEAELWIRDSLVQASAQRVDTTFLSATAADSGVSPAGLLNGVSAINASGTDAAALRADLQALYSGFLTAKNASGLWHVMTPSMAKAISLMVNALGQLEFPGLNADGGTFLGDRVVTGDNLTTGNWVLLKPSDIWRIGDSGVEVSMSDTATIEQDSAPTGASDTPTAASQTIISLWQEDSVGFKVTRRINFQKRRSTAVAFVQDGEYGGVFS